MSPRPLRPPRTAQSATCGFTRRQIARVALMPALSLCLLSRTHATPDTLAAAIRSFTGDSTPAQGRVRIDIAELVENGNAVPVSLTVDSPMSATDHVQRLALFTERNPQPEVAVFHLSRFSAQARVSTRMRLATSQRLVAVAQMNDGRYWQHAVDVIVTMAACVEG
jgi:sulfur-oxidizing protein SoxY